MAILTVIIVIICVLLIAIVLVQKSKGGGLAAGFQSSNQVMGAPKTADFLEKATWTLMGVVALLCIVCTVFFSHAKVSSESSALQEQATEQTLPTMPENVSEDAQATEAPAAEATPAETPAENN